MVTEADWASWQPAGFHPFLDVVYEAFGPLRVMFGSDWPVCTVAAEYEQVVDIVRGYMQQLSQDEQAAVFGETARKFYGLE
jgi:L-fuconolactonase